MAKNKAAQGEVLDFQLAGRQETNLTNGPAIPSEETKALRERLLVEEVEEFIVAQRNNDMVAVADGLADVLYVVLGAANAWGIKLGPVFKEVHRSNMTKVVEGELVIDEHGKVLKPPHYDPPDIAGVLAQQGWDSGEDS